MLLPVLQRQIFAGTILGLLLRGRQQPCEHAKTNLLATNLPTLLSMRSEGTGQ